VSGASPPADPAALGVAEAARLLHARRLSPVELVRACLERIERLDRRLNVFITVTAEAALAEARAAEAELARGRSRGPLQGIPVALKDLVETGGVRTTAASAAFADRIPERDAEVVRRLRAAGAVIIGKLNLHELGYGASSVIGYFGAVRNPWDPGRTAGGSSSGAAVAVACGFCPGAVGTDTGGSIRQPAAFCGITGLKPSYGRVSVRGVMPLAPSYDHVGPLARSAEDAALLLGVMAGPEPVADYGTALVESVERVAALRIGIARAHFFSELDPEITIALEEAIAVLRTLTAEVREVAVPAYTDTTLLRAEAWAEHRERALRTPALLQPETLRRLRVGADVGPAAVGEARRQLAELRRRAREPFEEVDLVVTPTVAVPPFPVANPPEATANLRERELLTLRNTRPFNALGLPTVSIPCGFTAAGLPVGMQLTGAPGDDLAVLRLAHAYQVATGWHLRRPPLP